MTLISLIFLLTSSSSFAVFSGKPATPEVANRWPVVAVSMESNIDAVCTGIEIAPGLVITAKHCLDQLGGPVFGVSSGVSSRPIQAQVERVKFCAQGFRMLDTEMRDIALVELSQPVTQSKPLPICDDNVKPESVVQIGYGSTESLVNPQKPITMGKLHFLEQNPLRHVLNNFSMELQLPLDRNSRGGDSGGPLIVANKTATGVKHCLLGVLSTGGVIYGNQPNSDIETATYVDVRQFRDWMDGTGPSLCESSDWVENANLAAYNRSICQKKPGHDITLNGCWPVTKEACDEFAGDWVNNECF